MASYAWRHGAQSMVVIDNGARADGLSEAEMFASVFISLGGKILQTLHLNEDALDHRDELRQLRYETDAEELLAELDEDLELLLPDIEMEIDMPINFDAIYLAQSGKQVSLLAGQLAYSGITGIPVYGSSRWQDGHLMDDRGRYLSTARFAASSRVVGAAPVPDDPRMQRLNFMYREAWGDNIASELTLLAYDSMRIIAAITSQLGLSGQDILQELREPAGFRALTGRVRFDASGAGQKQMEVFRIRKGKIVPAG
jgi:outer membrane PBP1 activator LpoA protein